jgi:hypothetical protein
MGVSNTPAQLSAKLNKAAAVIQKDRKVAVGAGALATKKTILAEAASKGVTPSSKIAGGKWGVRYDVKGLIHPTALVKVWGPFHLVDNPTKAHEIAPRKRARRGSGGRKKAVAFNGIVRARVRHPGTSGKKTFPAAKKKAALVVPKVMAESILTGWTRLFR